MQNRKDTHEKTSTEKEKIISGILAVFPKPDTLQDFVYKEKEDIEPFIKRVKNESPATRIKILKLNETLFVE